MDILSAFSDFCFELAASARCGAHVEFLLPEGCKMCIFVVLLRSYFFLSLTYKSVEGNRFEPQKKIPLRLQPNIKLHKKVVNERTII